MDYIELTFTLQPYSEEITEILIARLSEIGFESFRETKTGVNAYIPERMFNLEKVQSMLTGHFQKEVHNITCTHKKIQDKDWNAIWESNFKPVFIANQVAIRASFHSDIPKLPYEIIIDPKMAFGTGHHATTSLMIEYILNEDLKEKKVLDMGCGTSILGIMASKKGASAITAIDISKWAYDNSLENILNNNVHNITVYQGNASLLKNKQFDIILANINRNVLLNDMIHYTKCLQPKGILLVSGFYTEDLAAICREAAKNGLKYKDSKTESNWVVAKFVH